MVARGIQSFGQNGPWLAGWLSFGQIFFVKFAQTCDEQMLKISKRYLDSFLSNGQLIEKLLLLMDPLRTLLVKVSKGGPLATTIFHLIGHLSSFSFWPSHFCHHTIFSLCPILGISYSFLTHSRNRYHCRQSENVRITTRVTCITEQFFQL